MTGTYRSKYSDRLRAEGYEQGLLEGALQACRDALSRHLVGTTPEQQERIESCEDLQQLEEWVLKLPRTRSAAEILGE